MKHASGKNNYTQAMQKITRAMPRHEEVVTAPRWINVDERRGTSTIRTLLCSAVPTLSEKSTCSHAASSCRTE
jgi:hypothetical protein